jgi:hypothetical protein
MLIHRELKPYLHQLYELAASNRRKYAHHQSFMLYQLMLDYLRYWRELQHTQFRNLSLEAQDELYYWFTEKLLEVYDQHLDLYWLIGDIDGQPLFPDGREPEAFWRKKLDRPEHRIYRLQAL